jgi:hypothetical protein
VSGEAVVMLESPLRLTSQVAAEGYTKKVGGGRFSLNPLARKYFHPLETAF